MLTRVQIDVLKSPSLLEVLNGDTDQGFELTCIKAAYVIKRLNQVFDHCGIGWCHAHSPFGELHMDKGRVETVTEVAFQYWFPANNDCAGCEQVIWHAQADRWVFRNGGLNHDWNEPIFACGGKGGVSVSDARKSITLLAARKATLRVRTFREAD